MKVTGIFRGYDDIDAAIMELSDLGIKSKNVYISAFQDTDFGSEFAKELAGIDLDKYNKDRIDSGIKDYNPLNNQLFVAGAALINATNPSGSRLFSGEPDGANIESVSTGIFDTQSKETEKHYNKYVVSVPCIDNAAANTIAIRLRNSGAENVSIEL